MEDCRLIEEKLEARICKNLFLCNRQQTQFYLLMMHGEKPFKTKFLSAQLGCARLSFADAGHMAEYLHTTPGSVSALELMFDPDHHIQLVMDKPLTGDEYISARYRRESLGAKGKVKSAPLPPARSVVPASSQ